MNEWVWWFQIIGNISYSFIFILHTLILGNSYLEHRDDWASKNWTINKAKHASLPSVGFLPKYHLISPNLEITCIMFESGKIKLYLKPTALRFHFQPWPTIYTNLPLAGFPSLVWNKHRIFLRSADSQLVWIDLAMLPLVVAWTTTRSRKRHGKTLEYCTKKNYIHLLTTYLQIFVRFRLNKGQKNPSNCAHEMASTICEIWHFVDLNLCGQKSSCSPHTNFVRNCKTIGRPIDFLFSAFPRAKLS